MRGFVGRDSFGRVFVDKCKDNEEHLARPTTPEGQERSGCRIYFDDVLIPEEYFGQDVEVYFDVRFRPCTETK